MNATPVWGTNSRTDEVETHVAPATVSSNDAKRVDMSETFDFIVVGGGSALTIGPLHLSTKGSE